MNARQKAKRYKKLYSELLEYSNPFKKIPVIRGNEVIPITLRAERIFNNEELAFMEDNAVDDIVISGLLKSEILKDCITLSQNTTIYGFTKIIAEIKVLPKEEVENER